MSILQELERSLISDAPSYMEFLYRYDPKKKQVFAFYEGDEDSSFYQHILKGIINEDWELEEIVAGCKNNVLKLYREFDWKRFDKEQIIFFVDRDLSHWLEQPEEHGDNVFITDGYSVENYVVNTQGFIAWLIYFEGFARAQKQEIEFMVSEYELCLKKFKKDMMPIMAQAVVAKRHDAKISLSELKLSKDSSIYFSFQNGHISFEICASDKLSEKWNILPEYKVEIKEQLRRFEVEKRHYSVRGKWVLCFMAEIGEFMRLNSNKFAPSLCKTKVSPTCSVSPSQCFSVLAPYCAKQTPERLKHFLDNTYKSYLAKRTS